MSLSWQMSYTYFIDYTHGQQATLIRQGLDIWKRTAVDSLQEMLVRDWPVEQVLMLNQDTNLCLNDQQIIQLTQEYIEAVESTDYPGDVTDCFHMMLALVQSMNNTNESSKCYSSLMALDDTIKNLENNVN